MLGRESALSNSLLGVRVVVGTDPLTASSSLPRSLLPSLLQLVANQKNCTAQGPESQVLLALKVQLVQPRWSDWFYWQDWLSQGCTLFLSATKSIFFSHNESSEHIRLLAHELLALPGMQPASLKAFLEKYFKTQLGPVFLHHQKLITQDDLRHKYEPSFLRGTYHSKINSYRTNKNTSSKIRQL